MSIFTFGDLVSFGDFVPCSPFSALNQAEVAQG